MLTRRTKAICVGVFLFHLSITQYIMPKMGVVNVFPFYDWNLFAYNPPVQVWPMIRILEIDHKPLNPPSLVYHNGMIQNSSAYWRVPEQMIRFLHHLRGGNEDLIQKSRRELEETLFYRNQHVKYEAFYARLDIRKNLFKEELIQAYSKWTFEYYAEGSQR